MGNLDNGGYAFPIPNADFHTFAPHTVDEYRRIQSGMTLRDYFAAKAMQSLIARGGVFEGTEVQAYKIADAMLKAREA